MTFFLLTEEKEEAVLDWEDISEEEQRIWRDDGEDDLDFSEDSEEEEEEEEGEKKMASCWTKLPCAAARTLPGVRIFRACL